MMGVGYFPFSCAFNASSTSNFAGFQPGGNPLNVSIFPATKSSQVQLQPFVGFTTCGDCRKQFPPIVTYQTGNRVFSEKETNGF